jgi:hypothetical protein
MQIQEECYAKIQENGEGFLSVQNNQSCRKHWWQEEVMKKEPKLFLLSDVSATAAIIKVHANSSSNYMKCSASIQMLKQR